MQKSQKQTNRDDTVQRRGGWATMKDEFNKILIYKCMTKWVLDAEKCIQNRYTSSTIE